jgi:UDP-glucuronate 4-epimerase
VSHKVVVTGVAGFIGFHVAKTLATNGFNVIGLDSYNETLYLNDEKYLRADILSREFNVKVIKKDICKDDISAEIKDALHVINCAAIPGLVPSWSYVTEYFQSNAILVDKLISQLHIHAPQARLIHLSTSSVYGSEALGDEASPVQPTSPYGVSKLAGERILELRARLLGVDYLILRLFSVYGPEQRPDMGIRIFINAILKDSEFSLTNQGRHIRSFTYVSDICEAVLSAISYRGTNQIFNIGGGETASVMEIIQTIERIINKKAVFKEMQARPGDQISTSANYSLASTELLYKPKTRLQDGLAAQINWQTKRI